MLDRPGDSAAMPKSAPLRHAAVSRVTASSDIGYESARTGVNIIARGPAVPQPRRPYPSALPPATLVPHPLPANAGTGPRTFDLAIVGRPVPVNRSTMSVL